VFSGTVIVAADAFFSGQGPQVAASALQHQPATISICRDRRSSLVIDHTSSARRMERSKFPLYEGSQRNLASFSEAQ
jgi:hypothetical protein